MAQAEWGGGVCRGGVPEISQRDQNNEAATIESSE